MECDKQGIFGFAVKAALVRDGRLLIVQRSGTDTSAPGMWEFCGGRVEFGEPPLDALRREVMEEAGLEAGVHRPLYVSSFMKPPRRQIVIITYYATAGPGPVRLSFEHQDYRWATRTQALELLGKGIVRDLTENDALAQLPVED